MPQMAQMGGVPVPKVDDAISGVLIALFVTGAVLNMTILQINRRRSHKFILSGLLFGFCMARITANVLRIAWASHPDNVRLVIAASIFTNAGVLLLFIVNLIFVQRIVRAYHPQIGWSRPASWFFKFLYIGVGACLCMVIVAVVYSYYTLDTGVRLKLRDVQLTASTYLAILAFLPLPITIATLLLPRRAPMDKFGQGRMRTKLYLLLFTTCLLSLGAGFRAGVAYVPRPASNPAWFHHRACYYCFNFVIELIVVFSYALSRFDRRFHIPDGSSGPGHYSQGSPTAKNARLAYRVNTEEEVFGDEDRPQTMEEQKEQERNWEENLKEEINRDTV